MSLLPRSLFGRLALVLLAVVATALVATFLIFRQDRAALLVRHFGDTKVVQLQSVRTAIESSDARDRRETLVRIGREHGVRIVPEAERPMVGQGPGAGGGAWRGPIVTEIEERLRSTLGPGTEVRIQPGRQLLWVRVEAAGDGYWVGFPLPPRPQPDDEPTRAALWSVTLAAVLLVAAFLFARYLARPLRDLNAAVERVGRGEAPPPLPESGPSEIANLNRGFNRMIGNLRQLEEDRALLLAGVSHDLRTPLARLRLGVEMSARNDTERAEMVDDIEEMDRIIGQFLDFARGEESAARERALPDPLVAASVDRYARAGHDVRFIAGHVTPVPLRPTAFSRLVANLIDNALAYGAPPVEVTTAEAAGRFVLDVADRGPGIPPEEVERLKQPFTRASAARSHAKGVAGAGLGLAIVDRIARMHDGTFELLPREGGGTIARVTMPMAG
jgi:two-component system, OmpR family, osmolarity sensor histidine kinase EnvZ